MTLHLLEIQDQLQDLVQLIIRQQLPLLIQVTEQV